MIKPRRQLTLLLSILFLSIHSKAQPAPPKTEFRGVWIATITNLDWPAEPTINSEQQKAQFIRLLDMHKRNGINAIVMQVRPASDAFYPSALEPWSQWLTGIQGQAPVPYYDPLQFMIEETHKRGMEFHAWMNPYRAVFNIYNSSIAATHITRIHPEWFLNYGDKKYFDPGNKEAQLYVTEVVKDVVTRYDIDAIHFDDYFYPYRIPGKEFPDYATYSRYGNGMSRDAWRRSNVDSIIELLSRSIKSIKKNCQFGISPFGVWRNSDRDPVNGSKTIGAQSNYDDLYADILLWLKKGWIDYVAPQLYWEIGHRNVDYSKLVDWWSQHTYGKNCYIGLGIYRAGSNEAWRDKTQIPRQIEKLRSTPNIQGMIFFSSKTFEKNPYGWSDSLRLNYFSTPASTPKLFRDSASVK
ncbi:MAG: family 10 glycosylhydrolase [Bacteroidetes bacterium]|nr:family 10 glycosylhydrolase [Bacteroidota bacterium]